MRNERYRKNAIGVRERHNERKNEAYSNPDVLLEYSSQNVVFKTCGAPTYAQQFDRMVAEGAVSTRGLKPDAYVFDEMVFDVNTEFIFIEKQRTGSCCDESPVDRDIEAYRDKRPLADGIVGVHPESHQHGATDSQRSFGVIGRTSKNGKPYFFMGTDRIAPLLAGKLFQLAYGPGLGHNDGISRCRDFYRILLCKCRDRYQQ